jgi:hypothetical protein
VNRREDGPLVVHLSKKVHTGLVDVLPCAPTTNNQIEKNVQATNITVQALEATTATIRNLIVQTAFKSKSLQKICCDLVRHPTAM